MATVTPSSKIVVIGAGPVGALAALYAAKRGHTVDVYELRNDLRADSTTPLNFTKSINLALSERGVNALREAKCPKLLDAVLDRTLPMHGRMIHGKNATGLFETAQKYDPHGRYIRAIDRAGLNKLLLDELESMRNVHLHFNYKLTGADFKKNRAWLEDQRRPNSQEEKSDQEQRASEVEISFDLLIGADGAHSAVRHHLMKYTRMSYEQQYIDMLWAEFHIQPVSAEDSSTEQEDFKISPNHLHIWPAKDFMFIAIPSSDKSFTCTLFMPASEFERLDSDQALLIPFFKANFPGVVDTLIPADKIRDQYSQNRHLPLISIKCTPYHYTSSAVVIGDAAHAMVPFYGQGMNAGLEDVRVLFESLDMQHSPAEKPQSPAQSRAQALDHYTKIRTPDAHTINDLAMGNYDEMSSDVRSPLYLMRKSIEEKLDVYFPRLGFATQYSRISFGNQRYSEVVKAVHRQASIIGTSVAAISSLCIAAGGIAFFRWSRK